MSEVKIDATFPLRVLKAAVAGFVADAKVALRTVDDGTFAARADSMRTDSLVHFQFGDSSQSQAGAAERICARAVMNVVGAMLSFFDQMIAIKNLIGQRFPPPPNGIDPLQHYTSILQAECLKVAHDASLRAPHKVDEFQQLDGFSRESALSLIDVRNAIEHHISTPKRDLTLRYGCLKFMAGDIELTRPGQKVAEDTGVSLSMDLVARPLPSGVRFTVSEDELDWIAFTINHLIAPKAIKSIVPNVP